MDPTTAPDPGTAGAMICRYADLATMVRRAPPQCGHVRLVAIDGPGGAGKSVFAERLGRAIGDAPTVHTDDFASWEQPRDWWARLEHEVLGPLERGRPIRYRAYDWSNRRLGDWRELPVSDIVLLEGVSSSRRIISERLTLAIWIETPPAERLARGLLRDGRQMLPAWQRWIAEEDEHFGVDRPVERADVVVDGAPSGPHDPEEEYIRLSADAVSVP